jgi:threonine aldolase
MRFISAPWVGMLKDGAWLRHAAHANQMAACLESRLRPLPQVKILFPRQANAVFAELPQTAIDGLRAKGWKFYTFIGQGGCRFMCAWDTAPADIEQFAADLQALAG